MTKQYWSSENECCVILFDEIAAVKERPETLGGGLYIYRKRCDMILELLACERDSFISAFDKYLADKDRGIAK